MTKKRQLSVTFFDNLHIIKKYFKIILILWRSYDIEARIHNLSKVVNDKWFTKNKHFHADTK